VRRIEDELKAANKRMRTALPKGISATRKALDEVLKEAKGVMQG
jgi:hypothetical protein